LKKLNSIRTGTSILLAVVLVMALAMVSACAPTSAPAQQDTLEIDIFAGDKGSSMYVLSYGLSQILSKTGSWIKANVVETSGTSASVMGVAENPLTSIGAFSDKAWYDAYTGAEPYEEAIPITPLMRASYSCLGLVTLDPEIRTVKDIAGKEVSGYPTAVYTNLYKGLLESYGLSFDEENNFNAMPWSKAFDALKAGTLDVALCAFSGSSPEVIGPNPALEELMTTKGDDLYFIPLEPETLEFARDKYGYPWFPRVVSAEVHPMLKEDVHGYSDAIIWHCHASFPEDAAYEIVKVAVENYDAFAEYFPTAEGYTPEGFADMGVGEEYLNPGAIKLYKEKGIEIPKY